MRSELVRLAERGAVERFEQALRNGAHEPSELQQGLRYPLAFGSEPRVRLLERSAPADAAGGG